MLYSGLLVSHRCEEELNWLTVRIVLQAHHPVCNMSRSVGAVTGKKAGGDPPGETCFCYHLNFNLAVITRMDEVQLERLHQPGFMLLSRVNELRELKQISSRNSKAPPKVSWIVVPRQFPRQPVWVAANAQQ
jgi:hypothetical protein